MKYETEARPFLEYSDDASGSGEIGAIHQPSEDAKRAIRNSRLARDLFVFFIASLLWLGAIFFLLPWPSSSNTSATTTTATTTTATTTTTTTSLSPSATATAAVVASQHCGPNEDDGMRRPVHGSADDYRLQNITSNAHFESCGNSTAEARQNGCVYDTLLNHWVPAKCVDQEWIDEYQDDGSWTAFADVNLTQPLSPEDMGEKDRYYTSIRDHVNHCAMLWRKQFWTLFEGRNVFDGVIVNTYHTEHCAEFLAGLMNMNRTEPTLVKVGFSGCWIRGTDEEL